MKFHQSLAVCLGLMAGVTADGCFAQSTTNQNESVAAGDAPQVSAVAVPTVTLAPPRFPWKNTRASDTRTGGLSEQ